MALYPINPSPNSSDSAESGRFKVVAIAKGLPPRVRLVLLSVGVLIALVVPGVAGMMAVRHLLQVAESVDCRANLATDDSLSARLYCADELARNRTPDSYRDAIKLVSTIPESDPLRAMADRRIEQWSQELLDQGDTAYQEGDLDKALNTVRIIPLSSRVYATAEERMAQWKERWEKGEGIYKDTEDAISKQEWTEALNTARQLVKLGNHYWETTRYQELLDKVQAGKEQQKAERTAAEKSRNRSARSLTRWEQGFEVDAVTRLKRANQLARSGNLDGLRAAIEEAQLIYYGTPVYEDAQRQIEVWQQQADRIEDRQHLDRAVQLANRGNEAGLQAAIDEAFMVSPTGNYYEEARKRIDQWMDQLYRVKYSTPNQTGKGEPFPTPAALKSPAAQP